MHYKSTDKAKVFALCSYFNVTKCHIFQQRSASPQRRISEVAMPSRRISDVSNKSQTQLPLKQPHRNTRLLESCVVTISYSLYLNL